MSRMRIEAKVRTNADFQAMVAHLDTIGLKWTVANPTGKGHPALIIDRPDGGEPFRYPIACTPRSCTPAAAKVASLKRALRAAGICT